MRSMMLSVAVVALALFGMGVARPAAAADTSVQDATGAVIDSVTQTIKKQAGVEDESESGKGHKGKGKAKGKNKDKDVPAGLAKKGGTPPGLAKKGAERHGNGRF